MRASTLAVTASLILALTGTAFAQAPAGATGTPSNPGGVTSNGDKADDRTTGSAPNTGANPGGRSSDHNGTANTLGKNSGTGGTAGSSPAPRP